MGPDSLSLTQPVIDVETQACRDSISRQVSDIGGRLGFAPNGLVVLRCDPDCKRRSGHTFMVRLHHRTELRWKEVHFTCDSPCSDITVAHAIHTLKEVFTQEARHG